MPEPPEPPELALPWPELLPRPGLPALLLRPEAEKLRPEPEELRPGPALLRLEVEELRLEDPWLLPGLELLPPVRC